MPTAKQEPIELINSWEVKTPDEPEKLSVRDLRESLCDFGLALSADQETSKRNVYERWGDKKITFGEKHKEKTYLEVFKGDVEYSVRIAKAKH